MTIYLSEKDARRAGLSAPRTTRGRKSRPDIPSAGRSAPTGLSGLIAGTDRAWSTEYCVGKGYRLYIINTTITTGWCESEALACSAAKGMDV